VPTPLPRSVSRVDMNPPLALLKRPELAARIGLIAITWAEIERFLGMMIADMLGSDSALGMAIYLGLQSEGPQRTVIKAVAQDRLPTDLAKRVEAHLQALRDGSNGRNKIVHGVWGVADNLPSALIRIDRKIYLERYGRPLAPADAVALAGKDMEVWRRGDFRPVQRNLTELLGRGIELNSDILAHQNKDLSMRLRQ
jgi:hypothetical protein